MKFSTLVIIRDLLEREVTSLRAVYNTALHREAESDPGTAEYVELCNARRSAYDACERVRAALVEFDEDEW